MNNQWNGFENGQSLELALFVPVQLVSYFQTILHIIIFCSTDNPERIKLWAHIIIIVSDTLVLGCVSFLKDEEIWLRALVASCALNTLLALYQHVSLLPITRRSR